MAATYVHLSGRDVNNALLKLQGLAQTEETKSEKLNVGVCPRCKEYNAPVSRFCTKCGLPLEVKDKSNYVMNRLMDDEEFKSFMIKKITDLGMNLKN